MQPLPAELGSLSVEELRCALQERHRLLAGTPDGRTKEQLILEANDLNFELSMKEAAETWSHEAVEKALEAMSSPAPRHQHQTSQSSRDDGNGFGSYAIGPNGLVVVPKEDLVASASSSHQPPPPISSWAFSRAEDPSRPGSASASAAGPSSTVSTPPSISRTSTMRKRPRDIDSASPNAYPSAKSRRINPGPAVTRFDTPTSRPESRDSFDVPSDWDEDAFVLFGGNPKDDMESFREEQRDREDIARREKAERDKQEHLDREYALQLEAELNDAPSLSSVSDPSRAATPFSQGATYQPVMGSTKRCQRSNAPPTRSKSEEPLPTVPGHAVKHSKVRKPTNIINLESDSDGDDIAVIDKASFIPNHRLIKYEPRMASTRSVWDKGIHAHNRVFVDLEEIDASAHPVNEAYDLLDDQIRAFRPIHPGFATPRTGTKLKIPGRYGSDPVRHPWDDVGFNAQETTEELKSLLNNIRPDEELEPAERGAGSPPEMGKGADLFAYQVLGLNWLRKMEEGSNKGGILADDMGLGKTVQAIALMVSRRSDDRQRKTTLIVAPVALLRQWEAEIKTKVRAEHRLSTYLYHGKGKNTSWDALREFDVVITTYGTLASELKRKEQIDMIRKVNPNWGPSSAKDRLPILGDECLFYRVILDEAQNVKNKTTKSAKAVFEVQSLTRFCMTGTPMMNNVIELYSLIHFLRIKPYNEWENFNRAFKRPLASGSKYGRENAMRKLQALLKAILLRRTKRSTLNGEPLVRLPERTTEVQPALFSEDEESFYRALEGKTQLQFNRYLKANSVGRNYSNILVLLLRLRQAACHPHLIKDFSVTVGGTAGMSSEDLVAIARGLPAGVVQRVKNGIQDCPICMDAADNYTIFTPCGHSTCPECFTALVQASDDDDQAGAAGIRTFKCHSCRAKCELKKITDYTSFKRVYLSEDMDETASQSTDDDAEGGTGSEDYDSDDSLETEGSLKDFIADENEEAADADGDDDDDNLSTGPSSAKSAQTKGKDRAVKNEDTSVDVKLAPRNLRKRKSKNVSDGIPEVETDDEASKGGDLKKEYSDELDTPFDGDKKSSKAKGERERSKQERKKKKKKKKRPLRTLAELQKESRRNVTARREYFERLREDYISSAKIDKAMAILEEIRSRTEGEKTIVFSQFTSLLDLLEIPISEKAWEYRRYDGSMSADQRNDAVMDFNSKPRCQIMLVSLKAGNAGLNLTVASQVVLLDPFWNPYIEEQAIDRAHRIGQRKPVRVHRILVANTVEDRIIQLQERKRELIEGALDETASKNIGRLGTKELAFLFGVSNH